jgi:phosphoesterase, MJ0936 family
MRILVVSDTHKHDENLEKVLQLAGKIDYLFHLGDIEGSEDYIREIAGCPFYGVMGNNDFFTDLPREEEVQIGKYKMLLVHGHQHYVLGGTEHIKKTAISKGIDIVMFGHTHKPIVEKEGNIIALNPGSLTYPRQEGRNPSYIMIEIDENESINFQIKYLKG